MNQPDSDTVSIVAHSSFSVTDFSTRWQRARIGSILKVLPDIKEGSESEMIHEASKQSEETHDLILKELFHNCWRLGQSTKRFFGLSWELDDFKDVLEKESIPCLKGEWTRSAEHVVLKRSGCRQGTETGSFACSYWREALDGIVMGCGQSVHYARLKNTLFDSAPCEDIFFLEKMESQHLYPPVPDSILTTLNPVMASISRMHVTVQFRGLRDGNLYYELLAKPSLSCSSVLSIARNLLQQALNKHLPHIKLVDVAPRSVLVS